MNNSYYKFKETKEDGTIILKKKIIDETKYDIIYNDNELILKPKPLEIKIKKLFDFDKKKITEFRNSKILSCYINGKRPSDNKYFSILKDIYEIINSGKIITKNTKLNFETIEKHDKGFKYLKNIGISVQHKEAGFVFEEILNQCIETEIVLRIEIGLVSGQIIKYSVN